jgi:hypothetical protein
LLLRADGGAVQFIPQKDEETGKPLSWFFSVVCREGEVGLIALQNLDDGSLLDIARRLEHAVFIPPGDFADLLEELEALKEKGLHDINIEAGMKYHDEVGAFYDGWEKAMDVAIRLIAQRVASSPP